MFQRLSCCCSGACGLQLLLPAELAAEVFVLVLWQAAILADAEAIGISIGQEGHCFLPGCSVCYFSASNPHRP